MRQTLILITLSLAFAASVAAQDAEQVCISRQVAVSCLTAQDKATTLEAENAVLKDAVHGLRNEINMIKIELAKTIGEKTQLEASLVRYNAIIDLLLKNLKPKRIGLINIF